MERRRRGHRVTCVWFLIAVAWGAVALGYVMGRDTGKEYGYNQAEKYFKNHNTNNKEN